MDRRTVTVLATGLWLVTIPLAIAGGILHFLTRDVPVDYYGLRGFQGTMGLVIGGIGWLIATRRRQNPIGWIFLAVGVNSGLQGLISGYSVLSIARHDGSLPLTDVMVWLGNWVWVPIIGLLGTLVLQAFPEEPLSSHRGLVRYSAVSLIVFATAIALAPGQTSETVQGVSNPFAVTGPVEEILGAAGGLMFLSAIVLSFRVLIRRFRRSSGDVRQQMKLLTFAAAIAAVFIMGNVILLSVGDLDPRSAVLRFLSIGTLVSFMGIPIAAGFAILRYGLYEIDVVINKTIVYALLAVFITVVYVAVVIGVGAVVGSEADVGLSVAATAIVALAIQPARSRANKLANRLVYGKRASPYEALSAFAASLSEDVATEDTLPRLARLMTEATAATSASVWYVVGDELRPGGVWPERTLVAQPLGTDVGDRSFEVRHEDEVLGVLAVDVSPSEPLSPTQEQLLSDLASQAGLLLRNVRLIEELRASRQRLVAAQDAERRRIERDIHDGAQQQLVALAVSLKLARTMLDSDPAQAASMLEQLRSDATDALENLRDLARGIYPPLLAERGLVDALRSQAAKAPIEVEVNGDGVGRYAQEAEAAVYFCILEALQNVAKYAEATRARVEVRSTDGRLSFAVTDDGRGFDPRTARRGAGLTNMADRLDALGGALQVRSTPGEGSTIAGWVAASPRAD